MVWRICQTNIGGRRSSLPCAEAILEGKVISTRVYSGIVRDAEICLEQDERSTSTSDSTLLEYGQDSVLIEANLVLSQHNWGCW